MQTILIPPTSELKNYPQPMHLALSDLVEKDAEYAEYYKSRPSTEYIILDNSAYENGRHSDMKRYVEIAKEVSAQEVVVPDVLGDREETYHAAKQFFNTYDLQGVKRLMLVPHGDSPYEWELSFYELGELYYKFFIGPPVIGVARRYEKFPGGLYNRVNFLSNQRRRWNNPFDVHLLGWGKNVWDIVGIARDFPWMVRSIDSAKPFHYALTENLIPIDGNPATNNRPKDYFDHPGLETWQRVVAGRNITLFELMAAGRLHR